MEILHLRWSQKAISGVLGAVLRSKRFSRVQITKHRARGMHSFHPGCVILWIYHLELVIIIFLGVNVGVHFSAHLRLVLLYIQFSFLNLSGFNIPLSFFKNILLLLSHVLECGGCLVEITLLIFK